MHRYFLRGGQGDTSETPATGQQHILPPGPNKAAQLISLCRDSFEFEEEPPAHLEADYEPLPSYTLDCEGTSNGADPFTCPDNYLDMMNIVRELRIRRSERSQRPRDLYEPSYDPVVPTYPYNTSPAVGVPLPRPLVAQVTQSSTTSIMPPSRHLNMRNMYQTTIRETIAYHTKK